MESHINRTLRTIISIFILLGMMISLPKSVLGQDHTDYSSQVQKKLDHIKKHLKKSEADAQGRNQLPATQFGVNQQAFSTGSEYLVLDPDQSWNRNPNTNPQNNFKLFGQGQPAGNINGDSSGTGNPIDDYVVTSLARDEQTSTLEDQIWKTAVFFGGNTSGTPDQSFRRKLIPVGDLNGDGYADAISLQYPSSNNNGVASIYKGTASGYVQTSTVISKGFKSIQKQIGFNDFNRDGLDDVLSYYPYSGNMIINWGTSNLADSSTTFYEALAYDSKRVVVEDVDKDTLKEIVELSGYPNDNGRIRVLEVDTLAQTMEPYEAITQEQTFSYTDFLGNADQNELHLLDINGSGYSEIYISVGRRDTKYVIEYDSVNGSYNTAASLFFSGSLVPVGDLNSDGNHDFIRADASENYAPYIAYGNDDLNTAPEKDFKLPANGGTEWDWSMGYNPYSNFGDLTGDGVDDVLMEHRRNDAGNQTVGRRILDGTSESSVFHQYPAKNFYSSIHETEEVGDLNNDGVDDFAMAFYDQQKVEIYFGGTSLSSTPDKTIQVNYIPVGITGGDFNNDGFSDVIIASTSGPSTNAGIDIYFGESNMDVNVDVEIEASDFQEDVQIPNIYNPQNIGDVNDDGVEDFLIGSSSAYDNEAYINEAYLFFGGSSIFTTPDVTLSIAPPGNNYIWAGESSAALGDINEDGIDDFAVGAAAMSNENGSTGQVHIYYGSSNPDFSSPDLKIHGPGDVDYFGWGIAAGNFSGDDANDIAITSESYFGSSEVPKLLHVYYGGANMDNVRDRALAMPDPENGIEASPVNFGRVETVPDFTNDGRDELLYSTYGIGGSAALYVFSTEDSPFPELSIKAPNAGASLGGYFGMAVGDFTDNGQYDLVLAQPGDDNDAYSSSRVYRYGLPTRTVDYNLKENWNLVGIALNADGETVESIKQSLTSVYGYEGGYTEFDVEKMNPGKGYWVKASTANNYHVHGFPFSELNVDLKKGWNLISGVSEAYPVEAIQDPDEILLDGTLYGFDQSYSATNTLQPAKGYWIRASSAGTITFMGPNLFDGQPGKGVVNNAPDVEEVFDKIAITNGNHSRDLYFGATLPDQIDKLNFSLPPLPPGNSFDARFERDTRLVEKEDARMTLSKIEGTSLKLKIDVQNTAQHNRFLIKEFTEGKFLSKYQVDAGNDFQLRNNKTTKVSFAPVGNSVLSDQTIPNKFKLEQNYPNPFNPTTQIQYSVTEASAVHLEVFNILGRRVATLVEKEQQPGNYRITFDASHLASGVYLYQLRAGAKVSTKKLILLK